MSLTDYQWENVQNREKAIKYTYANEADMLNVVLFGKTAKQWTVLINQGKKQKERMKLLRQLAVQQLQTLEMVSLSNLPKFRNGI